MATGNWSRDELIAAFNLYCKIPFGRIHNRNPEILELADLIGRTASAVSWKLANFARLDPTLQSRGIAGASHGSKGEQEIWDEFNQDWDKLSFESEQVLARLSGKSVEEMANIDVSDLPLGKERETTVRVRVNQDFFRSSVLAAYSNRCCISGLAIPELLNASHIVPWSVDTRNRVNPRNGLCLNVLHDRAFDRGLLTITPDYNVKLSSSVKKLHEADAATGFFLRYENARIAMPDKFAPDPGFLEYHANHVFRG